jgi:formamidopyrimidine-DNA glycosylase
MLELPDVEVFRQYVDATSIHQKIKSVAVRNEKILGRVCARKLQRALNFGQRFEGRKGGVKGTLMNQNLLAAIGNVYSDKIHFQARLHPETSVARRFDPRRAPQRDMAGARDCDTTGSRSAQVTRAPSCFLTGTKARGARGATVKSGRAKPQDKPPTTALHASRKRGEKAR